MNIEKIRSLCQEIMSELDAGTEDEAAEETGPTVKTSEGGDDVGPKMLKMKFAKYKAG